VNGHKERSTAVLDVSGMQWASEQNVVIARLRRRPGVLDIEVNPVAQSATVVFDPNRASLAELRRWVIECGYHCVGQSVPSHICDPLEELDPPASAAGDAGAGHAATALPAGPDETVAAPHTGHPGEVPHAGVRHPPAAKPEVKGMRRVTARYRPVPLPLVVRFTAEGEAMGIGAWPDTGDLYLTLCDERPREAVSVILKLRGQTCDIECVH
jgi:copper chaperone CopZ